MRFDHLVHWVPNLSDAADAYRALGLHVVPGGRHTAWGTENALCHFGLPYIELLAVADSQLAGAGPAHILRGAEQLLAQGGGALTFALAVPDLDAAARDLANRGVSIGDPIPGSRRRPDGSRLSWRMAPIAQGPAWRPFLIEWGDDDATRLADLRGRGTAAPHPAGALQPGHLVVATPDPDGDAAWAARLVGRAANAGGIGWQPSGGTSKAAFVPLPGCGLLFHRGAQAGIVEVSLVGQPAAGANGAPATVCGLSIGIHGQLMLSRPRHGIHARGYPTGRASMFVVRAGATLAKEIKPSLPDRVRMVRDRLAAEGSISDVGNVLRLHEDHLFGSSSTAAAFVLGTSANGKHNWKPDDAPVDTPSG